MADDLYFWIEYYGGIRKCRVPADFKGGYWYGNVGVCSPYKDGAAIPFSKRHIRQNFFPTAEKAVSTIRKRLLRDAEKHKEVLRWMLTEWKTEGVGDAVEEYMGNEIKRVMDFIDGQEKRAANLEKEVVPE